MTVGPASETSPIRVLVAEGDEHQHPVRAVVTADTRLELIAPARHAAGAIAAAVDLAPEVIVLDEDLPGGALAAAVEIAARLPDVPLVVTHGPGEGGLVEALAAGASAYVERPGRPDDLIEAVVGVAKGDVVLKRHQVARVVDEIRDPMRPRRRLKHIPALTAREWQVLELMHSELSTPEIAERLVLSPVTVRSHARSIRQKLAPRRVVHH